MLLKWIEGRFVSVLWLFQSAAGRRLGVLLAGELP
jgi:hypothetical protein